MLKMHMSLDGQINGMNFKECHDNNVGFSLGGFSFLCDINGEEKDVPVDWDCYVANVQFDNTLLVTMGEKTWFGGNGELDDVYDEEYKRNGIVKSDLTAKLLASTSEITDFSFDYDIQDEYVGTDYLHIVALAFEDETGVYNVDSDVLNKFNGMDPFVPIKAEGDLGSYDEFDGNYPDESDLSYQQSMYIEEEEELPF